MAEIKQMEEKGTNILPVTSTKAVFDEDGNRLDNIINGIDIKLNEDGEPVWSPRGADTFSPFSSVKVYIGIFDTNVSGNKYYIPVDDNVEIDQLCCYQYKNSTATVYDVNYSLTQARRYYGSSATVYNIENNTTADSIGKDSNGFYLCHTNIAGYPYRYFAIGHIK